jgi:hypothetical protein
LYEHAITNPVLITAFVFVIGLFFVTGFTMYSNFYNDVFIKDLMVEAHGVVFDIFMLGVVIFWLQQKGRDKVEKKRYFVPLANEKIAEVDLYVDYDFITVEVEFDTVGEADLFDAPGWFGKEVTNDAKYKNINLAK